MSSAGPSGITWFRDGGSDTISRNRQAVAQRGATVSAHISELASILKRDSSSPDPKYPVQAVRALEDERVAKALQQRLENGGSLTGINSLGYNFFTGLNHISFHFTLPGVHGLKPDAVLVILDADCRVIGLVDPFDIAQPNRFIPPLPSRGEQPFVLARPSCTDSLTFEQEELYPSEVRSREFFERLKVHQNAVRMNKQEWDNPDGGPVPSRETGCRYSVATCENSPHRPPDERVGYFIDDCG